MSDDYLGTLADRNADLAIEVERLRAEIRELSKPPEPRTWRLSDLRDVETFAANRDEILAAIRRGEIVDDRETIRRETR